MSLHRSLSRLLSSSRPQQWLRSSSFCTETQAPSPGTRASKSSPRRPAPDLRRPSEIPFQAKIANCVHLVGSVSAPVRLRTLPGGVHAVALLVQESKEKSSPWLSIPVIFKGDLAQIAACHLKESDCIYITGQLTGDLLPHLIEDKSQETNVDALSHIQILADSLYFVQRTCQEKETKVAHDQDLASDHSGTLNEPNNGFETLWHDLVGNPEKWWDYREDKLKGSVSPKYPDFKNKDKTKALWLSSAPNWVLSKLDGLVFSRSNSVASKDKGNLDEPNSGSESLWRDLVGNPLNWCDKREDKRKGSVSSKFPDFTQKGTSKALWLDVAPNWVLAKLDGLVFCASNGVASKDKENLWKSLVEDPSKWWDNRSRKFSPKSPDFKQKDTGEGLWLDSNTPQWVLSKLPPPANQDFTDPYKVDA